MLRYSGLTATDAQGRVLHSWLELHAGRLLLRVDASTARYPLRIDPFIQQGEKHSLAADDRSTGFGYGVALSSDGNTALIGGPATTAAGRRGCSRARARPGPSRARSSPAAARSATAWLRHERGAVGGRQHRADRRPERQRRRRRGVGVHALGVDLDPAGLKAHRHAARPAAGELRLQRGAVGRRQHRADRRPRRQRQTSARRGCSRARARPGPSRARSSPAAARPAKRRASASSVALSADGNTALIGGPGDNRRRRRGVGVHALGLDLDPAGREADRQRRDRRRRVRRERGAVGRRQHRADRRPRRQQHVGAAWVFTRSGSTWTQQGAKLTGSGETGDTANSATAWRCPPTANTALIGGPGDNAARRARRGCSRARARPGPSRARSSPARGESRQQANSARAWRCRRRQHRADRRRPTTTAASGAAWVFTRSGSTWTQQGAKLTGTGEIGDRRLRLQRGAVGGRRTPRSIGGPRDNSDVGRGVGVHALGLDLDPAGRKAHRQRRDRRRRVRLERGAVGDGNTALIGGPDDNAASARRGCSRARARPGPSRARSSPAAARAARRVRHERGAVRRRQHRADRRPRPTTPASARRGCSRARATTWTQQGAKLDRQRRERQRRVRLQRGAVGRRQHRADRRPRRQQRRRRGVGVHALGRDLDPAGLEAHRQRRDRQQASSATSVALSADGNTALIGGPGDNCDVGAAWVFTRSGSTWTQQGTKLTGSGEIGEGEFRCTVALSAERQHRR